VLVGLLLLLLLLLNFLGQPDVQIQQQCWLQELHLPAALAVQQRTVV
jgi:hypothetical protein